MSATRVDLGLEVVLERVAELDLVRSSARDTRQRLPGQRNPER
jgi:hypothetical protein